MKKKKIRIILTAVLAGVFLVSSAMVIRQQIQYRNIAADSLEAARLAGVQNITGSSRQPVAGLPVLSVNAQDIASSQEPLPEEVLELAGIDLDALRAVNGDVVGWISIPGTTVSYPLMHRWDNQYYLGHNWKGEHSSGGSVFLECTGSADLSGFHTIVYGHRMHDGSMFGSIGNYKDPDYWREHPSVYIVLDEVIYRYDIFSAQKAGVRSVVYRLDIVRNGLEEEFIEYCTDGSVLDTGLSPDTGDRFLTLSTCTGSGYYSSRWVVHGVLAQEYRRINS